MRSVDSLALAHVRTLITIVRRLVKKARGQIPKRVER